MMEILQAIFAFIVAVGALIAIHEFGHYWAARRCNVLVLKFSIGFGRPLFKRQFGEDETDFVVGVVPLGGYVSMLDERQFEPGKVPESLRPRAFNNRPLRERCAITVAGPLFNLLFAVAAYWLINIIGITGLKPVADQVTPGSPAAQAGLADGDEILSVGGKETPTWRSAREALMVSVLRRESSTVAVRSPSGYERLLELNLAAVPADQAAASSLLDLLGVTPHRPALAAVLGTVTGSGAAAQAGLKAGDRIIEVDGAPVQDWAHWVSLIQAGANTAMEVQAERNGVQRRVVMTPQEKSSADGNKVGYAGVAPDLNQRIDPSMLAVESYPVHIALAKGVVKTLDMSVLTLQMLGRMVIGQVSLDNLSGPITIAHLAGRTAQLGLVTFLSFLAIVSISLGVLNLLPIPMLDGGHLMYYAFEFFKGSPVSEATQLVCQKVGIALLFCLMSLAIYNDIARLLG